MALAFQSAPESTLNLASFSSEKENENLQQEAFAGELAMLRQKVEHWDSMIDALPAGIVILDGNGVVTKINQVANKLLDEPILGQPWFDVIKRSFNPRADDWHEVSLKDGRRVKLDISPLANQPGQMIMITDLTETRLLQDKISHMQRLSSLGKMVSSLAHQIRTPLSAAMLYGANLKNDRLDQAARNNFQDKLMLRLGDLEQQVNDMLLFAKSGENQVVETLKINNVIKESVQGLEAQIERVSAKLEVNICKHDCEITGNQRALTGAIQNLIHNSLSIIGQGAHIKVEANCSGKFAFISVIDNGPGIDESLAKKIFEPFYTSRQQGTGLGLAVVKSVAKAHKGDVVLMCGQKIGAHFCIRLPLISEKIDVNQQSQKVNFLKEYCND